MLILFGYTATTGHPAVILRRHGRGFHIPDVVQVRVQAPCGRPRRPTARTVLTRSARAGPAGGVPPARRA